MRLSPKNKNTVLVSGLIGALLVSGVTLTTLYGGALKAGVYNLPSNPLLPGSSLGTSPNPQKLACQLHTGRKDYITKSITQTELEISSVLTNLQRLERIKGSQRYLNEQAYRDAYALELAYYTEKFNSLKATKVIKEKELIEIQRLIDICEEPIFEPPAGI